jgi:DNA-binding transcriptional regulator YiaG
MKRICKEEFVRSLSRVIRGSIIDVAKMHGELMPDSIAKRVSAQLWGQRRSQGHLDDATWVRHVRGMLGLTQRELARKLHTTQVTVARWESGVSHPSRPFRLALEELVELAARKAAH